MSNILTRNAAENAMIQEIMDMHSYRRPKGSQTEREYREKFLLPLGCKEDAHGNLILQVGEAAPTVLWSSHTDTVHRGDGLQRIQLDGDILKLHKKSKSSCLGADDGAGNWIMMEMIRAKVPGLYIFHWGEESGGIGSHDILAKSPETLAGIQIAVAFDRRGKDSVITHQGSTRTASDAFAKSIAVQLPEGYRIDTGGSFTDTAVYKRVIPECSNLSVGYEGAHSSNERLDVAHLIQLRNHMVRIDASKLVVERDPEKYEALSYGGWSKGNKNGNKYGGYGSASGTETVSKTKKKFDPQTFLDLVWEYPEEISEVLEDSGIDVQDVIFLVKERIDLKTLAKDVLSPLADAVDAADDRADKRHKSTAQPAHPPVSSASKPTTVPASPQSKTVTTPVKTPGQLVSESFAARNQDGKGSEDGLRLANLGATSSTALVPSKITDDAKIRVG